MNLFVQTSLLVLAGSIVAAAGTLALLLLIIRLQRMAEPAQSVPPENHSTPATLITSGPGSVVLGIGGEQLSISWQVVARKPVQVAQTEEALLAYAAQGRKFRNDE